MDISNNSFLGNYFSLFRQNWYLIVVPLIIILVTGSLNTPDVFKAIFYIDYLIYSGDFITTSLFILGILFFIIFFPNGKVKTIFILLSLFMFTCITALFILMVTLFPNIK